MNFDEGDIQGLPKRRVRNESRNAHAKLVIDILLRAALEVASDNNTETPETNKSCKLHEFLNKEVDSPSNIEVSKAQNINPTKEVFSVNRKAQSINEAIISPFTFKDHTLYKPKLINKETTLYTKKGVPSSAYMKRNVYKSIIRHMLSYVRKNNSEVVRLLQSNGFEMNEIEEAIHKIRNFNELEKEKGNPKKSQAMLKSISSKKSPCTYILRETLRRMERDWDEGKLGRISMENLKIYREVCNYYYTSILKVLN